MDGVSFYIQRFEQGMSGEGASLFISLLTFSVYS